jgi:hypothetical protein
MHKKAERIRHLYNSLTSSHRDQWVTVNQKGFDFANDNQLTTSEKEALVSQGMPDFTINRITPVVEMLNYYATANTPRWQAIGVDGSDSDVAAVFSDIADYIWSNSQGQTLLSNAINDAITKSLGYLLITVDQDQDRGMGEVVVQQPDPFDVYVDPKSRDSLFKDAAYVMIKKLLPKSHLKKLKPDYISKINKAATDTSEMSFSERDTSGNNKDILQTDISSTYDEKGEDDPLVDYFEVYEKVKIAYYNVFYKKPLDPAQLKELKQRLQVRMQEARIEMEVGLKEQQVQMQQAVESGGMLPERFQLEMKKATDMMENQLRTMELEFSTEIQNEMSKVENKIISEKEYKILMENTVFANTVINAKRFHDNRIKLTCVVGDQFLYENVFPEEIKEYPIVPIHYKWIGTPYPISAVSPLVGKQRELNKAHQLMIHNASLGSSLRWAYYEGSIDTKVWEEYSSSPGALLPVNHGYELPKELVPQQLSNAFFSLVQAGKGDMEYLAGVYAAQQGDTQATSDMPYRGMLAMDEYGTRRVKYWLKHSVEPSMGHLGEVIKQFSQAAYKAHKVFRIVQPNSVEGEKQVEINKPLFNDLGQAIGRWNDYETAKFDIRMVAGSTMPVNRWAYLQELKELLNAGVIDPIAVLAETDIRNKERVAGRMDRVSQLESQIGGLEDQIKDKDGTIDTLERQLVQLGIKDKVRQAEMEIEKGKFDVTANKKKELYRTQAEQKALRSDLANEARMKKQEMGNAVKMFENSLHSNKEQS